MSIFDSELARPVVLIMAAILDVEMQVLYLFEASRSGQEVCRENQHIESL